MINTKGSTLKNLENKIKFFLIPKSLTFTVSEWKNNKQSIIRSIKNEFRQKVIFRSSTTFEDTNKQSAAGAFDSFLNIDVKNTKEIRKSIENIISGYKKKLKKFLTSKF